MSSLAEQLSAIVAEAFVAHGLDPAYGDVVPTERPEFGHFQCNGALVAAKSSTQSTREIAEMVAADLREQAAFREVAVAGPGFINLTVADELLATCAEELITDPRLGVPTIHPELLFLDYGGPNVAKPLHVGHLRSSIIGQCLKHLYRFAGHTVIGDIHLGDWGTPMGMVICGVRREQPNLPYFDPSFNGPYPSESPVTVDDLARIYPVQSTLCKSDPEAQRQAQEATVELQAGRPGYRALWQHFVDVSVAAVRADFAQLGVDFEQWNGESTYHEVLPALVARLESGGYVTVSDGAKVIYLEDTSDEPPLILVKADGAYLYATSDLATVDDRVKQGANRVIYVVDQRQDLHFKQVFQVAYQTGLAPRKVALQFYGFGTINGTDGKPFKTRAGGIMRLSDLIEQVTTKAYERMVEGGLAADYPEEERQDIAKKVGVAALKFGDLSTNRSSNYVFDLDRFVSFDGRTGPYLIYTAVRIKSIFRKLDREVKAGELSIDGLSLDIERALILTAARFPEVVEATLVSGTPHYLCEQAFVLAQQFNRFYQECHILSETHPDIQNRWLALSHLCLHELELVCQLLGIEIPERM